MDEVKEVTFTVDMKLLAFHNLNMKQVVEPGEMKLYVGASSEDIRPQETFQVMGEERIVDRKVFSSKVTVN
ncbi:fibronectin type III-like domain-contianing protein [Neobacillus cucumis]|uniref:fibronectin type III-like domain-contianing protein n=1 Tax=Neobacillus cucumis TaxID=1740721 RepID=UPI002E23A2DD|nr:fibronectin type III-like domain-contianing protein [Neobacillus cucumis]